MHWKECLCILLFPLTLGIAQAQTPTQTIRGQVVDGLSGLPLAGANVALLGQSGGTQTDSSGRYRLEQLKVGRYQLQVSYVGYEPQLVAELLLESGKELIQNVELQKQVTELEDVVVRAEAAKLVDRLSASSVNISMEETFRLPGTFFDPARLATNLAGVVNNNDQANNMVIRGNSPNGFLWRLEGLDIVNPNHLSNAGTFSDRPAANGGGVNILSGQMLGNSAFFTGAFPTGYSNALSGVMSMSFRRGNDEKREHIAQVGLLGIDLATEGPLSTKNRSSYLLNYRYSTLGLFSALGVQISDEDINFQDLSFHVVAPTKNNGRFHFFGMGGSSKNDFEAMRDTEAWEFEKDRQDIRADNKMGAIGMHYHKGLQNGGLWLNSVLYSALESTRRANVLSDDFEVTPLSSDRLVQSKLSFRSLYKSYLSSSRYALKAAFQGSLQDFELQSNQGLQGSLANGMGNAWLLQPYVELSSSPANTNRLTFNIGLQMMHFTLNGNTALEPRIRLDYQLSSNAKGGQNIGLAYGLHSQLQLPQLYTETDAQGQLLNQQLGFTRAHHFVLSYQNQWKNYHLLRVELYYQRLFDVPISANRLSSFSALNMTEAFRVETEALVNEGTGQNYGVEVSWKRYFFGEYFFMLNGSLYNSRYEGSDGIERNTRFNGNYILNINGGREFKWNKKGKEKRLGINARLAFIGGFRDTPIDVQRSTAEGITAYVDVEAFSLQQKDFFRPDLRIYLKNNKNGFSSTVSLDIQNVANISNEAYSYYDQQQQRIVVQNQLGLIPILSYRIEF
ncbi:MAG: carboxypeptidase-like regulatory domain-containing protein [Bacteroidota bacterium]